MITTFSRQQISFFPLSTSILLIANEIQFFDWQLKIGNMLKITRPLATSLEILIANTYFSDALAARKVQYRTPARAICSLSFAMNFFFLDVDVIGCYLNYLTSFNTGTVKQKADKNEHNRTVEKALTLRYLV